MKRQENAKEPSKWNGHGLCHSISRTREIPGKATRDCHILSTIIMILADENVLQSYGDVSGVSVKEDGIIVIKSNRSGSTRSFTR